MRAGREQAFRKRFRRAGALLLCALAAGACRARALDAAVLQTRLDRADADALVELGPGTWTGPLVVRRPLTLRGAGTDRTVLAAPAGPVLRVEGAHAVALENLAVHATDEGLVGEGARLRLVHAVVLGGTGDAVRLRGGELRAFESSVLCADEGGRGVAASDGARVEGTSFGVDGGCSRALEVHDGELDLAGSSVGGARVAGLHLVRAKARLADVRARIRTEGSEPFAAVFSADGTLEARRLTTEGGEFGLLVHGGRADVEGLEGADSRAAAVSVRGATTRLAGAVLRGPFAFAAVQLSDAGPTRLERLWVRSAGAAGVTAVRAPLEAAGVEVFYARRDADGDFGHAFMVIEGRATLADVRVERAEGAALWASAAEVTVRGAKVKGAHAGLVAVNGARVDASCLDLEGADLAAFAMEGSTLEIDDARLAASTGTVECSGGRVRLGPKAALKAQQASRACTKDDVTK